MVLAYLAQVGDAAYGRLSHRQRARFIGDLRGRINAACAAANARSPERVRRILREFGDPEDVVLRACRQGPGMADEQVVDGAALGDGADGGDEGEGESEGRGWAGSERPMPAHRVHRDPPPWRGGPDRSWLRGASGARGDADAGSSRATGPGPIDVARRYPAEALTIGIYLISGIIGGIVFLWLLGAVLAVLSRVWSRVDRWVAVVVPVAATVGGMALWQGEAPYVDQFIMASLLDTGVIGLRVAAVACGLYFALRLMRLVRRAEVGGAGRARSE
ncbi:hypothetical protein CDO52_05135 [Nocardiopsis gilva YIM 90087]|uniref:Uncharacterized protein n=1 Tax=Nocardiopsis gilva YIM 90087 TaxID=1235441 RepID=A0A223S298_9ACTN|nr:hypothetical protein CDO52_05135 [Nocardiopsis gilva YIM 90087]